MMPPEHGRRLADLLPDGRLLRSRTATPSFVLINRSSWRRPYAPSHAKARVHLGWVMPGRAGRWDSTTMETRRPSGANPRSRSARQPRPTTPSTSTSRKGKEVDMRAGPVKRSGVAGKRAATSRQDHLRA
jgi:hypothetical protein